MTAAVAGPPRGRLARVDLVDLAVPLRRIGPATARTCPRRAARPAGAGPTARVPALSLLQPTPGQLGVERRPGDAGGQLLVGPGQLLVDERLEAGQGLGAHQQPPVEEEARRPVDRELLGQLDVGVHPGPDLGALQGGLPARDVEPDLRRVFLQRGRVQRLLVGEHLVVHLPEPGLLPGRLCGERRRQRPIVEGQRPVLENDAQVVAVAARQLVQGGEHPGAEGALELAEGHHGDLGGVYPAPGRLPQGDLEQLGRVGAATRRSGRPGAPAGWRPGPGGLGNGCCGFALSGPVRPQLVAGPGGQGDGQAGAAPLWIRV